MNIFVRCRAQLKPYVIMKTLFILLGFIFFLSCKKSDTEIQNVRSKTDASQSNARIASGTPFNMLWNGNGVTKRSFIHQNLGLYNGAYIPLPAVWQLCDLSEAHLVGNPFGVPGYKFATTSGDSIESLYGTKVYPSFKLVTEGYPNSDYGNYPGFAIWVQNGFTNSPLEFKCINSAKQLSGNDKLHEVGLVFEHWRNPWNPAGYYSFTDQYDLNQLSYVKPQFDVRLDHFNNYQSPELDKQTADITADLRIEYWKDDVKKRTDLLGVIFSNLGGPTGYDFNNDPTDNIFWRDPNPDNPRVLLHGYQLGLNIPNLTTVSSSFTTITFDYKPLILQYLPAPPPGCDYSNAIIVGFDIYSSTRYADIDFSLKNIYLNSEYN
jgi:hypothetical protein